MRRISFLLPIMFSFFSCHNQREDAFEEARFSTMMEHFYIVNYSYPKNVDDFLYRFYREDERSKYDFLSMVTNKDYSKKALSFEQYDSLMEIFQENRFLNWRTMKENKKWLTFEENDSVILLHNVKEKECYIHPKMEYRAKMFLQGNLDLDTLSVSARTELLKWIQSVKYYGEDSVLTTLPWSPIASVPEESSKIHQIMLNINEKEMATAESGDSTYKISGYILHYDRYGNFHTPFIQKEIPQKIVADSCLRAYLDSCMLLNQKAKFVQFYAFDYEKISYN